ncbi:hypothetical protein, partial [Polaromonas hydrogenivorans]|uniref:hypothetical protein n=1 Tax=Polaromonas hydrogenivorans TaxID=335476 RepID=UPI0039F0DFA9
VKRNETPTWQHGGVLQARKSSNSKCAGLMTFYPAVSNLKCSTLSTMKFFGEKNDSSIQSSEHQQGLCPSMHVFRLRICHACLRALSRRC